MSLEHSNWRYVGNTGLLSPVNIDAIMDALYVLGTSETYADGSVRTPGSGSAGTWNRYQNAGVTEAVYVTTATDTLDSKIIIAGSSSTPSPSPSMCSPDSWATNSLNVGIAKNSGVFASWNAVTPFTSGQFSGYWRFLGSRVSSTLGNTGYAVTGYLYESKDSVAFALVETGANSSSSYANGFMAGALFDSESDTDDTESDGKIYGLMTSGHYGSITLAAVSTSSMWNLNHFSNANFRANLGNDAYKPFMVNHATAAGGPHAGVFSRGSSSAVLTVQMAYYPLDTTSNPSNLQITSASMKTPSNKYVRIPMIYRYINSNNMLGRLREVSLFQRGMIPQRHMNGSSTVGYLFCCSNTETADAVLLGH